MPTNERLHCSSLPLNPTCLPAHALFPKTPMTIAASPHHLSEHPRCSQGPSLLSVKFLISVYPHWKPLSISFFCGSSSLCPPRSAHGTPSPSESSCCTVCCLAWRPEQRQESCVSSLAGVLIPPQFPRTEALAHPLIPLKSPQHSLKPPEGPQNTWLFVQEVLWGGHCELKDL